MIEKNSFIRSLSTMEESLTLINAFYPMTVVCAIRSGQSPSTESVRNALDRLQRINPLLQASIQEYKGRFYFKREENPDAIPFTIIPRKGDDHWSDIVRTALNKGFDHKKNPLMSLHYLDSSDPGQPGDFIFSFHHAITDSLSVISMVEQLLSYAGDSKPDHDTGTISYPGFHSGFPLLNNIIPAAFKGYRMAIRMAPFLFRQFTEEIRYRIASREVKDRPIPDSSENGMLTIAFNEKETQNLVKWSRREKLSLNSILTAAMLIAVNNQNYCGKKEQMRTVQFLNLRPYLHPPVNQDIPGSYIAMTRVNVQVASGGYLIATALGIDSLMIKSSRRGEKFLYAALSKLLVRKTIRALNARLGHTALSYAGVVRLKTNYGSIHIHDIHAFITNNRLGAELTAFGKIFSGKLSLDLNYLTAEISPDEAVQLAGKVQSLVLELISEP